MQKSCRAGFWKTQPTRRPISASESGRRSAPSTSTRPLPGRAIAREQLDERRLAAPVGPGDGRHRSGGEDRREAVDDRPARLAVAEADVLDGDHAGTPRLGGAAYDGEGRRGRRVGDQPALLEHQIAAGEVDQRQVVLHDQEGPARRAQVEDRRADAVAAALVKVGERLVEDEHRWVEREHGGEGDEALLASGQSSGRAKGEPLEAEPLELAVDPPADLTRLDREVLGPERQLVLHRGHHELVVGILEHHADPRRDGRHAERLDVVPEDAHRAGKRAAERLGSQPGDAVAQGGLAAPGGARDDHRLAGPDAEAHVAQH